MACNTSIASLCAWSHSFQSFSRSLSKATADARTIAMRSTTRSFFSTGPPPPTSPRPVLSRVCTLTIQDSADRLNGQKRFLPLSHAAEFSLELVLGSGHAVGGFRVQLLSPA
ncbi:hypothetical protein SPBR_08755 [Sporothrix brasiliensis 5110]|uniref:Uncharacterized protein n=1 Tax=Sporothrix brasiliensis 5110 TaxID=1398154 RepID=A0A0C2IBR3_9PEZI|nr:uncharacterized protein SPBR_08755 [Sporothrix brasiliensis 5110]KIH86711.1 hypothetical protein SPBR_08755 [Sporothrix brasiliensis 5110]